MKFWTHPTASDARLIEQLESFIPSKVFDLHAHLFHPSHCPTKQLPGAFTADSPSDLNAFRCSMEWRMPKRSVTGLFFGYPSKLVDRTATNRWMAAEISKSPNNADRTLALVAPDDDPAAIRELISREKFVGLKPYHIYANLQDTMQARIEDFAPDWMWQICHEINGVLMLHIVRDRAIADRENVDSLRRLCRKYPRCQLVLAHIARSFNYRHALENLAAVKDLPNAVVDTALVTEPEAMRAAIQILGPERLLYGSDFPFSELRGKCTSVGDGFAWIYADDLPANGISKVGEFTLLGMESVLSLRDACNGCGLPPAEVENIFFHNARRILGAFTV